MMQNPELVLGATAHDGSTRFVAYCTTAERVEVWLYDPQGEEVLARHTLSPLSSSLGDGIFVATVAGVGHGALYKLALDGRPLPDPYARFLPLGVHGPAMVVEPHHVWRHGPGIHRPLEEHVIYELHIGTFTREGTYLSAAERIGELAALGVTALELMPLSSFPGARGWGYDGVAHYAPFAPYGTPDELRAFIDAAHGAGLAVLLDVVYNHFGPSGNYLPAFSEQYFTREARTAWGDSPDFAHRAMRRYVLENARYWLDEFRFDGLRLDAVHAIDDPSPRHVLRELADDARRLTPRKLLIAEDERNDPACVTTLGMDAIWADDFHHQVRVTLTRERDGYYAAYEPGAAGIANAINRGWLYQGETYPTTGKPRGKNALELATRAFVYCIQNHDQIGNRALGERLSVDVPLDAYCAASMLLLFLPMTPLLFMGQEWAASSPFLFFTDHEASLGEKVSAGRRSEFKHFKAFSDPDARSAIPDPQAAETFLRSRLDWSERELPPHARVRALYQSLLALRRTDPVLRHASRDHMVASAQDGVLEVKRWKGDEQRLLLVNLSREPSPRWPSRHGNPRWRPILTSSLDAPVPGTPATPAGERLPPYTAVLFEAARPEPR